MRLACVLGMAAWLGACAEEARPAEYAQVAVVCPPGADFDGSRCVRREVTVACPPGSKWSGTACVAGEPCPTGMHLEGAACIDDAPRATDGRTPPVGTVRDPRKSALQPRATALIVTELQQLEALVAVTEKSAPDRPLLLRRLAEDYVELSNAAERDQRPNMVAPARKKAITYYRALRDGHPEYPHTDDVLYYAGLEYERAGDLAAARALYQELARRFPSSPHIARIPPALAPPQEVRSF